jgi:thiamine biosynthesis lipoprotein
VGPARWTLKGQDITLKSPGVRLDLGGIVKGYLVDEVVRLLRGGGARGGIVQLGGEIAVFGELAGEQAQRVAIRHPERLHQSWCKIQPPRTGLSVSTSGNYHRPLRLGRLSYYHVIDPRTGSPVSTHTLSVTVAFPRIQQNALADALSTAGTILPRAQFLPLVLRLGGEALILTREGGAIREYQTNGWEQLRRSP